MKRTGVTVILPGGTRVRFPRCHFIKPHMKLDGSITRVELRKWSKEGDDVDKGFLGYAPPTAVIQAHWHE